MSVTIDQILDITGERVPFSERTMNFARAYMPQIPLDVLAFMEKFGEGDFNGGKFGVLPPERWQNEVHEPHFETPSNLILPAGQLQLHTINGIYFAATDVGDELIATGQDNYGIVLKSRLYGGFCPSGKTFAEALQGIFMSPYWDVLKATRIYFNSRANRWPSLTLRSDTTLEQIETCLTGLATTIIFDNEDTKCYFFPAHQIMISLENTSTWENGSDLLFTMGQGGVTNFIQSLKVELNDLGFV